MTDREYAYAEHVRDCAIMARSAALAVEAEWAARAVRAKKERTALKRAQSAADRRARDERNRQENERAARAADVANHK